MSVARRGFGWTASGGKIISIQAAQASLRQGVEGPAALHGNLRRTRVVDHLPPGKESEFFYYLMELADPVVDDWNSRAQGDYQPKTLK